jgi:hypothetical protein
MTKSIPHSLPWLWLGSLPVRIYVVNQLPFLKGEVKENARKGFLYWSDDGDLMALRVNNWKVHFLVQHGHGFDVWKKPFESLRAPDIQHRRCPGESTTARKEHG